MMQSWMAVIRGVMTRLVALGALAVLVGAPARADEVTVFAAASLRDALTEISDAFERQTGHTVTPVFAGSPVLARQIDAGAPADIFLSANAGWMDWLETRERIDTATRFDLASNRLVLVAHGRTARRLERLDGESLLRLLGSSRLAMGQVESVPAGVYGRAALETYGVWADVSDQVVQADNVRAALAYVTFGEVPFGLVYRSDARAEPRVSILAELPEATHPVIRYPAALISGRETQAGEDFLVFLRGPQAREALGRQGFVVDTW